MTEEKQADFGRVHADVRRRRGAMGILILIPALATTIGVAIWVSTSSILFLILHSIFWVWNFTSCIRTMQQHFGGAIWQKRKRLSPNNTRG